MVARRGRGHWSVESQFIVRRDNSPPPLGSPGESAPGAILGDDTPSRLNPRPTALTRPRLNRLLPSVLQHPLTLIVAPAGSGKTTLLGTFSAMADAPIAWCWLESTDGGEGSLVRRLERAVARVLPGLPTGWQTVEDVADTLHARGGRRLVIVIDDFHLLRATPAERSLERLVGMAPPGLCLFVASRVVPGFNLPRLRVLDAVVEIGPDDLRFRSWEVERLFLDFYRQHLPPDELTTLARRTYGWAAALQLFHLSTRGRRASYRRDVLAAMNKSSGLVEEFLTRNVVDELPSELRSFLIDASVLGRISGPLCDRLLDRQDSGAMIQELEARMLLAPFAKELGEYRCHEVLNSHLHTLLLDEVGEVEARARYRRAGALLESTGATLDAARAYARAEETDAVRRLVGDGTWDATTLGADLLDILPSGLRDDPWLILAQARRYRADGRFDDAVTTYRVAARAFGSSAPAAVCQSERRAIEAWLAPDEPHGTDWAARLRHATIQAPLRGYSPTSPSSSPPPLDLFVDGMAALLSGSLRDASALVEASASHASASPGLSVAARAAFSLITLLSGDPRGVVEGELAAEDAERLGLTWLARLCRAVLSLSDVAGSRSEGAAARMAFEHRGDHWGSAIALLIEGFRLLRDGDDACRVLADATERLGRLNAPVLQAWADALHAVALARDNRPEAALVASRAEAAARACGARAAQGLACLALAECDARRADFYRRLADGILGACGLSTLTSGRRAPASEVRPPVAISCFGGFQLSIDGSPVDLSAIKPRARQALRLLCIHGERAVHREVLLAALWPDVETSTGMRSLHVAISSLRALLQVDGTPLIAREGSAYRLLIPERGSIDVIEFERMLSKARSARTSGDPQAIALYRRALELYRDELLPEEGPAEWVVPTREYLRTEAYTAARELAHLLLAGGDPVASAAACERGLQIDPYRDDLWQLRIEALGQAGEFAAAARARHNYDRILSELGVFPAPSPT